MTVDNWYVPSGYMGDGEDPEARYLSAPQTCATRAHSNAVGQCHRFEYDAGPAGQAGVFWQYPANNWGENGEEGLPIPEGAQSIRFFAWSDTEGTVVKFMVGLSEEIDGFTAEITNIELSTEPTEYTIDIRNADYSTVIGAFGWYAEATDAQLTIHVDDIHWSEEPPLDDYIAPELVLPLSVEAWFSPSGYMGDGEDPEARYLSPPSTCSESGAPMLSSCTEFSYTAGLWAARACFGNIPLTIGVSQERCVDDTIICDTEGLAPRWSSVYSIHCLDEQRKLCRRVSRGHLVRSGWLQREANHYTHPRTDSLLTRFKRSGVWVGYRRIWLVRGGCRREPGVHWRHHLDYRAASG